MKNRKIVEYRMVGCTEHYSFIENANNAIQDGFQPYGNPFVGLNENNDELMCQAMVKYADE